MRPIRTMLLAGTAAALAMQPSASAARDRMTAAQASAWYARQPWLVGSNYTPATAVNELEFWQAETFDPKTIAAELALAESIHMNTMRVFLHNMLWEQDRAGFKKRIATFLEIAHRHHIKPLFVLFDSCWDPDPKLGPQRPPIPGVHNSGWVQAPGAARLADASQYGKLEAYVKDIVGSFAKDDRILGWDVWNEPDNGGGGGGAYRETPNKTALVATLLPQVFAWARAADPTQPLTSGVWTGDDWTPSAALNAVERAQLGQSDIISFHDYSWPETFEARVKQLVPYGRPILCTEYMARGNGSTFDNTLPIGKKYNVGMINWGFVDGKTQTRLPWDSWQKPYVLAEPVIWFHEVFRANHTPYRLREVQIIKALADAPKGVVPDGLDGS